MDAMARVWRKIPGVKENCYAEWFFEQLWGFRFEGHLVDVTLCAEGREIPCHRLVLSACTDYFKAMFSGAHSESKKDKIEIGGVSGEALERLVDFAYTFNIRISSDNVQPLFEAANMLQIKYVEESCEEFLEKKLGPNTCLRTCNWALADKLSYPHLSALARSYALKKFEKVCRTEEFLQLPVRFLKVYISDEGLHAREEERVLEAIMRWARHDLKERQRHLEELLACVRFSCMDQSSLEKIIETDPVLSEVPGIKELINDGSRHVRPRMIQQEEIIVLAGSRGVSPIESGANESIYRLNLHCDVVDSNLMPRSLRDSEACAVCVVNNDIILTGGTVSPSQAVRYNSSRNSWIKLPSLRKGRLWHGMAAVNG
ncbi:kelch-like protein 24 [Branchiostoma lanceolatum]|uniref:kelch-like protein 24 n=1 Tax=Branchiostoma lanceolatum TaxID=7740 RepID=UPI0034556255